MYGATVSLSGHPSEHARFYLACTIAISAVATLLRTKRGYAAVARAIAGSRQTINRENQFVALCARARRIGRCTFRLFVG